MMHFSLIDPFAESQYVSEYLALMIDRAERLGATQFQLLDSKTFVCHVRKCGDGEWQTSDPAFQNCPAMLRVQPMEGGV